MNIIKIPFQIVKPLFRSVWFWGAVLVIILVFWLSKWKVSKAVAVLKLLAKMVGKLIVLFLGLFAIDLKKKFDEVGL